jgi:YidC/Oxa1 family membrane protein insertase
MSLLDPLSHALAALIAAAHTGLTQVGADPAAGSTWLLCIAAVVVTVRLALLPLVAHGVRLSHASARARPHLQALTERYRSRTDRESVRRLMEERRRLAAEHGMPRLGCLPMLVQLPIWIALYHLVTDVAAGVPVGAMSPQLVASLGAAYVTQKYVVLPNTVTGGLPEAMATAQQLMPAVSALGLLMAGGVVPAALLVYWVCNSLWTLGQSLVIRHWFPTPGSPAAGGAGTR